MELDDVEIDAFGATTYWCCEVAFENVVKKCAFGGGLGTEDRNNEDLWSMEAFIV